MQWSIVVWIWCLRLPFVRCIDNWVSMSAETSGALWLQRDIMGNVSIDQVPLVGVDIKKVISVYGEDQRTALLTLSKLLEVGVQALVVNVEYDNDVGRWLIEDCKLSFSDIIGLLHNHILQTEQNMYASQLVLLLKISGLANTTMDFQSLADDLRQSYPYIYSKPNGDTKNKLLSEADSNLEWPTLNDFFYNDQKRLVIAFLDDKSYGDVPGVFESSILHLVTDNSTITCPIGNLDDIIEQTNQSWRFLYSEFQPEHIQHFIRCGYSPIIANNYDLSNISGIVPLIQSAISWPWSDELSIASDNSKSISKSLTDRCASFSYNASTQAGYWKLSNCYERLKVICSSKDQPHMWHLNDSFNQLEASENTYFSSFDSAVCPENYQVGLPKTPMERISLQKYLADVGSPDADFWIDLNSISVKNCWVTGGPLARCAYVTFIPTRSFSRMFYPACVVLLIITLIIILLDLVRIPIQDNRKGWKRIVNTYAKSEIEGVPS
ncbi:Mtc6p Ecym_2077 [Eremothecium cymbalariae DBVPG|uniref:Maintenance of telomere capping protein 6 n=1 Tax=Eremothecium cymbalariae (strain CBS 270.75 / DBVPG 7215 / KCTC 17166 / NRRL Y-17582) TaxID=931890 RepID=G8JPI4_ERECY|nr:Hypothetical protein Ecym_2077 [Eremothecium cymbalariae DBVPG\